jgi:sodium transport system permease protein
MSFRAVAAIFSKELIDFVRDRRTLFGLVILPLFVMPVLIFGMGYFISKSQREAREKQLTVALAEKAEIPGLKATLEGPGLTVKRVDDPKSAVERKEADAGVEVLGGEQGPVARILTDNSKPEGNVIAGRIRQQLDALKQRHVAAELTKYRAPQSILQPFRTEVVNVAPPRKMGGMFLGMILGFILVTFMISAGMYPAMDMTGGEKERRTIEMLLASPATRQEIVGGKLLATLTATVATTVLSITSFGLTFYYARGSGPLRGMTELPVDALTLSLVGLSALAEAVFSAALILAVAAAAKSVREATSYLTPIIFVAMLAGYAVITPGVNLPVAAWMLPFANFVKLTRDLFMGDWSWSIFALTIAANFVYAAIAYQVAVRCFTSERLVLKT